jgi:hypothetical protein
MWGADAEIGWRVPLERFGYDPKWGLSLKDGAYSGRHHELRLFAGGFYFDHKDFDGEVAGPRARAEWRIGNIFEDWDGSRLTFEAAWQHDDVRDHQIEGGVRLRIPLGGERGSSPRHALNAQERRMTEGLKRDTDIVSQSQSVVTESSSGSGGGGQPELVEDAETGVSFDTVVTVANGDNLQDAITTADQNALIIALGGSSNFGSLTMLDEQTLLGGGGSIQVRGRTSGTVATYTAPGVRPIISADSGIVVVPANNTHINGVTIDGLDQADHAIRMLADNQNVYLTDIIGRNTNSVIINLVGSNQNLTMQNSELLAGFLAFATSGNGNTLTVDNNSIHDIDHSGFDISGDTILTVKNTTFGGSIPNNLFFFFAGNITLSAESTGNIDNTSASHRCSVFSASLSGSIEFTTGLNVSTPNC